MQRMQVLSIFFIALLIFVLYQTTLIFKPFLTAIFWSAILAFGFHPLYMKLRKRFPWNDGVSAFVMTVIIILIVVPPLIFLVVNVTGQAIDLYQLVANFIREGRLEELVTKIRALSIVERIETHLGQWEPLQEKTKAWILQASENTANFTVAKVGALTKNIFFIGLNTVFMAVLIFVFLKDGMKIYSFIYNITPLEEKNKGPIFTQVSETFSAVIRGQITTSLVQASLAGVVFMLLGVPAPIFFAAATFFTTLIPVIGAAGVWLPLAIYLVTQGAYIKAAILVAIGVGVISVIDNIIKPAVIGEKTKLPYFLLFFGILGGLHAYGLMGIFLAPLILSLFFVLTNIFRETYS